MRAEHAANLGRERLKPITLVFKLNDYLMDLVFWGLLFFTSRRTSLKTTKPGSQTQHVFQQSD